MTRIAVRLTCLGLLIVVAVGGPGAASGDDSPAAAATTMPAQEEMIELNFPESIEVRLLVQYVSKRLNINILYDDTVGTKRVRISSPTKIPKDSLPGLLQSVLKMVDLSLVDSEQPGWKRIVSSKDLMAATKDMVKDPKKLEEADAAIPIMQMFELKYVSPASVDKTVRPFLSQPGGNTFTISERNLIVITDYAVNVRRMAKLIELLDKPGEKATIQFIPVKHIPAAELAQQVETLLKDKDRIAAGAGREVGRSLVMKPEPRTNQIAVISTEKWAAEAIGLIRELDVPSNIETRSYSFQHIRPRRIDQLIKDLISPDALKVPYKSTVDDESGLLIASAPPQVHERIASLKKDLDMPEAEAGLRPIRFYKLVNTTAAQVLATIRAVDTGELASELISPPSRGSSEIPGAEKSFTGANKPPAEAGKEPPRPPFYKDTKGGRETGQEPSEASAKPRMMTTKTKDAVVTADTNTNTIIVVASPAVQEAYKKLISMLDKRRPQVLIEVTMVTLNTSGSFSLGVEITAPDEDGDEKRVLTFSSFGLSTVDANTGALSLIPGMGFNGTLVDSNTINIVLRALAANGHAKVLSAPKVLVNDNSTASLSSVAEAPFTSINASQTVSTTSFAGYASAGTTVAVTPHISEGDHLQLQFSVTLNSFTGEGAAGVPPPRQTDTVSSEVTVPDGYAVIVGGLKRQDISKTISKIPFVGDIPILKYLASVRSDSDADSALFIFIRPIILRDDRFEDLKYFSDRELELAKMPLNLPINSPMLMSSDTSGEEELLSAEPQKL